MIDDNIVYCKVFGERNTGTNFLNNLISLNTDLQVLDHGSNEIPNQRVNQILTQHFNLNRLTKDALGSQYLIPILRDRLIDQQRKDEFHLNYGWKHALIPLDQIMSSPRRDETLFICLIRNPWRFVSALHRRPYNLFPTPNCTLEEFITRSFLANERDQLKDSFIENPVELWNKKVSSYFNFKETSLKVMIVYYECLVEDVSYFLNSLSPYCAVSSNIQIPFKSTKGDQRTFEDYRLEALTYDPLQKLGETTFHLIKNRLDLDILSRTIYSDHFEK